MNTVLYLHIVISGCPVIIRTRYLLRILKATDACNLHWWHLTWTPVTYIGNPNVDSCYLYWWHLTWTPVTYIFCSASYCGIAIMVSSTRTSANDDPLSPSSYVLSWQHHNTSCKLSVTEHPSVTSLVTACDYSVTTHWNFSMPDFQMLVHKEQIDHQFGKFALGTHTQYGYWRTAEVVERRKSKKVGTL